MNTIAYIGRELDLFAAATRWKAYLHAQIAVYLGRDVLEVGAGFGGTTRGLCLAGHRRWLCVEPDADLAARLERSIRIAELPLCCRTAVGTLESIPDAPGFDTILYIDVLEHIAGDAEELAQAARRLRPGGHIVVLSPAHDWLFTPFDRAIGHHRRYSRSMLEALTPLSLEVVRLDYLDAVGLLASLGNRLLLRQSVPTARQLAVWDKLMVPLSRRIDPLLGYSLGKSVLGVWTKPLGGARAGAAGARARARRRADTRST